MSGFNLSDALPSPLGLEESVFKPCCPDMTPHHVPDAQDRFFGLDEGLDMVVSRNPKTMERVATLLLAVGKMKKKFLSRGGRKLSDHELCSVIMENLVEETIVEKKVICSTGNRSGTYIRLDSGEVFTLCDDENKDVVQETGGEGGEVKLQAVTLKGGHCERKVNFTLAKYTGCPGDGETVRLSITINNTVWHISCSVKDSRPTLKLEEYSKEQLQTISNTAGMDRFLFFKRLNGSMDIGTFESVRCPGWFISTSLRNDNEPVEMCEADAPQRITKFKI